MLTIRARLLPIGIRYVVCRSIRNPSWQIVTIQWLSVCLTSSMNEWTQHQVLPGKYVVTFTTVDTGIPAAEGKRWATIPIKIVVAPTRKS